ncbi:MAG: DUF1501 domain-containing protein [Candidatus Kapabacteria bacterium]|nr:DUF1501 domain-containing protein [Candidatus Kapabacteria bacterium]
MKRRSFLKTAAPVLATPLLMNGLKLNALSRSPVFDELASALAVTDRYLVLIQLNGGNDGINTVIPLDQLSVYNQVRSRIAIPESKALKISDASALHPAMTGIQTMFKDGMATLIQGVTYPNPNQSHFRSTDIWMTGSDSNQYIGSGWAGRYLTTEYPNYPKGYPNAQYPDPPAIQIGAVMPLALMGPSQNMGLAIQDPNTFYTTMNAIAQGNYPAPPATKPGNELAFIRQVQGESKQYSKTIKDAYDKATNKVTYPTAQQNSLAVQMATVARLIAGGLKTRIYVVQIGGFDTHALQVDDADTTTGAHATLLGRVSESVALFYQDLKQLGVQDKVLSMTFSEFGRRVEANGSAGTDHGTAAPMFVFGTQVNPGIIGVNPSLTDLDNQNLKMQHDYRSVYFSVLKQWFGADSAALRTAVFRDFPELPIIKTSSTSVSENDAFATAAALSNYPNPVANGGTTIRYTLPDAAEVNIRIMDANGRMITTLAGGYQQAGTQQLHFDANGLANGMYIIEVRAGLRRAATTMVVER